MDRYAATRHEVTPDLRTPGLARRHEVIQNPVYHFLVETSVVAEGEQVNLQRLAFDAKAVRHVLDVDGPEVRLSRDWTKRGELRAFKVDHIIAAGMRVPECLQRGFFRTGGHLGFAMFQQRQFARCHGLFPVPL